MFGSHYCNNCGHQGDTHRVLPGKTAIQLALWSLPMLPAWWIVSDARARFDAITGAYKMPTNSEFELLGIAGAAVLVLAIFAIAYTAWRHLSGKPGCRKCDSTTVIPSDSPNAAQAISRLKRETSTYTPVLGLNDR